MAKLVCTVGRISRPQLRSGEVKLWLKPTFLLSFERKYWKRLGNDENVERFVHNYYNAILN